MKQALAIIIIVAATMALAGCGTISKDGEHTGYVTAVEKNGLIWKTGTVYFKTDLSSSQEDLYCVEQDDLYNRLKEKSANKEKVTLQFHSEFITAPWRCENEPAMIDNLK